LFRLFLWVLDQNQRQLPLIIWWWPEGAAVAHWEAAVALEATERQRVFLFRRRQITPSQ